MMKIIRLVATNDRGMRIGEGHHRAKHSDALVDRIRDLHEDNGYGYRRIAHMLKMPLGTVRMICTYEIRAQTTVGFKKVESVAYTDDELVED